MLQIKHPEHGQSSGQSDVGYYAPILGRVLEARRLFHSWVDTIPEPVGQAILRMSQGNQRTPMPGNLVGERDAFWFGELVGASEDSQLVAAVGSIAGYAYFLHQDHVVDGDGGEVRYFELARNLLYAKLLESFEAVAASASPFWGYWNRYLSQYTAGSLAEADQSGLPRRYSSNDLAMVAARSAPVKICLASLAIGSGKPQVIPHHEAAIEGLTLGLQIRDDLADCVEDMLRSNYTPVLSRLVGNEQPSMHVVKRAALYTDLIEELLDDSTLYLHKASQAFRLTAEMSLQAYIEFLRAQNHTMKRQVREIKESIPSSGSCKDLKAPLSPEEESFWYQIDEATRVRLDY